MFNIVVPFWLKPPVSGLKESTTDRESKLLWTWFCGLATSWNFQLQDHRGPGFPCAGFWVVALPLGGSAAGIAGLGASDQCVASIT